MRMVHRGLTIELELDDPRVAIIETVLFGRPLPPPVGLPPPLPMPELAPPPPPEPEVPPVPAPWQRFWDELTPVARQWLSKLAAQPIAAGEVKKHLSGRDRPLVGLHKHIAATARRVGVPFPIEAHGRGKARRYFLSKEEAARAASRRRRSGERVEAPRSPL